jgi:hypothetical protein
LGQNMNQRKAALRALDAALLTINQNITVEDAARMHIVSRGAVKYARMILMYGSVDDVKAIESGAGLTPVAEKIRTKMTPEELALLKKRSGVITDKRRENLQTDTILWGKFSPMLRGLTELPSPVDMLKVITTSGRREETVSKHLSIAIDWLQEFNNAWAEFQRNKRQHNDSNAGRSNEAS